MKKANAHGFTLLEVLVAVAVFAVMSVMAYGGLNATLDSQRQSAVYEERLAAVQRAMSVVSRDIQQAVQRPVRDAYGDTLLPLQWTEDEEEPVFEFTRGGWRNPARAGRSHLQRIAYRMDEGKLLRSYWKVLDRAQDTEPVETTLLAQVTELRVRFLDAEREWWQEWPPAGPEQPGFLPLAIEFSIELEDWGVITRVLQLPKA